MAVSVLHSTLKQKFATFGAVINRYWCNKRSGNVILFMSITFGEQNKMLLSLVMRPFPYRPPHHTSASQEKASYCGSIRPYHCLWTERAIKFSIWRVTDTKCFRQNCIWLYNMVSYLQTHFTITYHICSLKVLMDWCSMAMFVVWLNMLEFSQEVLKLYGFPMCKYRRKNKVLSRNASNINAIN